MQRQGLLDPTADGGEGRKKVLRSGKKVLGTTTSSSHRNLQDRWGVAVGGTGGDKSGSDAHDGAKEDSDDSDVNVVLEDRRHLDGMTPGYEPMDQDIPVVEDQSEKMLKIDWLQPAGPSVLDVPIPLPAPLFGTNGNVDQVEPSYHTPFLSSTKSQVISRLTGRIPPTLANPNFESSRPLNRKGKEKASDPIPESPEMEEDEGVKTLLELLRGTVERGEGNSCLIQGVPGGGKTTVRTRLSNLVTINFREVSPSDYRPIMENTRF